MRLLPLTLGLLLLALALWFGPRRLGRLASLELRGGWLAALALLVQAAGIALPQLRLALLLISAALLVRFCWLNRGLVGIGLASCGIALNMAVMAANGGAMPIPPESLARLEMQLTVGSDLPLQKSRVLADEEAVLAGLGDRLHLPGALGDRVAWSIGDVLLIAGIARLLAATLGGPSRHAA
jgi:hypothetical protein